MFEPKALKRLFDELDNGYLDIIVDVYNYLYIGNYEDRFNILKECLELFKDKIKVFHIKDFIVQDDKLIQVGIGKGIMGWDKMLPLIYETCPNAYLVFEGVKKEEALGNRTVLDVLDAFQTLLNSQVEVVKARREYYLSAMQVMQAMGKLTAKNLKLDVELYNPKVYYKETRDKWLSTSID